VAAIIPVGGVPGVGTFLPIAGGTMTGDLILANDPAVALEAATKEYVDDSVAGGITQTGGITAAGTIQGDATVISSNYNIVTTVASGTGVILSGGGPQSVTNFGANDLKIYPPSGSTITTSSGALATDAPFTLGANMAITFVKTGATTWFAGS